MTHNHLTLSEVEGRRLVMQCCKTIVRPSTTLRSAQGEEKVNRGTNHRFLTADSR